MAAKKQDQYFARDRARWRAWLEKHHDSREHVHLVFLRKALGKPCISYDEAVEEALCFGWIDGIKHKLDDERYCYRFTPRRPGSAWSESNRKRIARLLAEGRMAAAGLAVLERAKQAGDWDKPPRAPVPTAMPTELQAELRRSAKARRVYQGLAPSHQRQWQRWIAEAKRPETRQRRAAAARDQLLAGGKSPN